MHPPRHKEARRLAPMLGLLLAIAVAAGCGGAANGERPPAAPLLQGARGSAIDLADRDAAARLATQFGSAYARAVYQRHPPRLPGATRALDRLLAEAATRVPASRRHLHPRPVGLSLILMAPTVLHGSVSIADGHSPPFSVGFTLEKRGARWGVVAASPPG